MNETEDSIGAEVSIIDLNEVPMEFIMTCIFINYEMGCGQLKLCGDDISWLSHALRILDLDTKYVSGHNHRQDPNGPFPGTLYTHGEFKMHQNRKNRKGDKAWYTCAKAATGCPAVAWVEAYTVEREDGTTVWQHRYTKVSPYEVKYNYIYWWIYWPWQITSVTSFLCQAIYYWKTLESDENYNLNFQVHTEYHPPDPSQRVAELMKFKMKEAVKKDPLTAVGEIKYYTYSQVNQNNAIVNLK